MKLATLLNAYRRGQADVDDLDVSLTEITRGPPEAVAEAVEQLEAARAAGLPDSVYARLRNALRPVHAASLAPCDGGVRLELTDETTAMDPSPRGNDSPTEVNPAAGRDPLARAPEPESASETTGPMILSAPRTATARRPDPTITDMGLVSSGEEPTGTFWPALYDDSTPGLMGEIDFQPGDVLRGRFELTEKLGEGGMGAVWKGKDLLKEEAKDRDPFVAIKLLQADFKRHPEAFIALQRETSKQQRLAHPNIATVYDFDRDEKTQTVFMTMEVMEGQPMDAFIRNLPSHGLPMREAMDIIEQLGAGLAYAHDNGLVHSDLKPGNCFITSDGTVKLLDFGISRASKAKADLEGETTLFDPAELGALTPTYATLEMFDGQPPDPRDDIFALGILSHQLLTGRHPYGKKSAPKAKELGLRPTPVTKLSARQNRGLARALALEREHRTADVEHFLDDLRHRHSAATYYVGGTLVACALIAVLAYKPASDLLSEQQHESIIAALQQPGMDNIRAALGEATTLPEREFQKILDDPRTQRAIIEHIGQAEGERVERWLSEISAYPASWQRSIIDDERARSSIVDYFRTRIFDAFDPARERYDYARATEIVEELGALYPDSATVLEIETALEEERDLALDELRERFDLFLERGLLIPEGQLPHIGEIVSIVRRISPDDPLLADDRLRLRFGELAEEAREDGDYDRAVALIDAGLGYASDAAELADLRFQVDSELARMANEKRAREMESRLGESAASWRGVEDFRANRAELVGLAALRPESPLLAEVRDELVAAVGAELDALLADARPVAARELLLEFSPLLDIRFLGQAQERVATSMARQNPGRDALRQLEEKRVDTDAVIVASLQSIEELLDNPVDGSVWTSALERPYKSLLVLLPSRDPRLVATRERIARHFIMRARAARAAKSFNEAQSLLAAGRRFHPSFAPFRVEDEMLATARSRQRARRERERVAALEAALIADFRSKVETNQVQEAKQVLAELEDLAEPAQDEFVREAAPRLLADAYARLAAVRAGSGDHKGAISLARAGLEQSPGHAGLERVIADSREAIELARVERRLLEQLGRPAALDVANTAEEIARLRAGRGAAYEALAERLAEVRADTLLAMARTGRPVAQGLAAPLAEYRSLFAEQYPELSRALLAELETRLGELDLVSPDDVEALAPVAANIAALPRAQAEPLRRRLVDTLVTRTLARNESDSAAARDMLAAARTLLPGERGLIDLGRELPLSQVIRSRESLAAGRLGEALAMLDAAVATDAEHPGIAPLRDALESAMRDAEEAYADYARDIAHAGYHEQRAYDARHAEIAAMWRDNPTFVRLRVPLARSAQCTATLAGYGTRPGGTCYDLIEERKGPEMVVVPPGDGVAEPFAIGRFEVSVAEFGLFCEQTGRCDAPLPASRRLPVTGIPVESAEAYARWLSERASANTGRRVVYRLPSDAEWRHAAQADGAQPKQQFNCRVVSVGEVINGHSLVEVESGQQNGWGLANYSGNAREWVRDGEQLAVRGGAYTDPLTTCGPGLKTAHAGEADELTGFRLVRELSE